MPDYAALQAEIALPAYADMTDQQIVDALNAPIEAAVDVPIGDVVGYLGVTGKLTGILGYSGDDETTKVACSSFAAIANSPQLRVFQCSQPATLTAIQTFLGAFVAAGLLSADDRTVLLGMAQTTTTRARQLGFGQALLSQIAAVRAGAASTATVVRVIYSAATRQPRRVIVPSTDADLAAHVAGAGEAVLDIQAADFQTAGGTAGLSQIVANGTGLPVLIAVIVDADHHVVGNVPVDPACGDTLPAGQALALQSPAPVTLGWLWDGGVGFAPPG